MKTPHVLVLMEWYDHPIREGIGRYAAERNWYLTVNDGCTLPKGWSGNGMLALLNSRADFIDYVRRQRVPCVDFGAFRPDIPLARVCGDHRLIGRVAADHLIERGFRQAAYFSTEYQRPHELRGAGFAERFADQTGHTPKQLVWAHRPGSENDDWQALNRWLMRKLRALPKPLAVFCYCDYDAAKIESACLESGYRVPDDVAILGVDNDRLVCENLRVPISSVRHDRIRVGYDGAALLDRLMRGGKPPEDPILIPPCGVELRASTDGFATADPLARSVVQFFRENIGRSIGVADAAEAVRLAPHRLEEHFSRVLGQTVYATLARLRLFEARRLLSLTDLPVKEIARRTGFCHAQHLNNAFRRAEHCTPLAYRKKERLPTSGRPR
ncbi:MAG TPA: DNA-binding transcriptional regulator [Phycisphaerae bacterium]|nr:DNA-binding transcriptional regulator [Phycisphaerae bacterium]